jgi:signal recognition particle GTPase
MKMTEDEDSDTDEDLMKEITKVKQEVNSKEELMVG